MSRTKELNPTPMDKPSPHGEASGSLRTYTYGFVISVALTLAAFLPVARHIRSNHTIYSDNMLLCLVLSLAIIQFVVQLVFFLHLGRESKPRWNLVVFSFMLMVLLILVLGSLWIMANLNYNMLTPEQVNQSIFKEENIGH